MSESGETFVGMNALRCHASDRDAHGHQVSCPEPAWGDIPVKDAEGRTTSRVPVCWHHLWLFVQHLERERAR